MASRPESLSIIVRSGLIAGYGAEDIAIQCGRPADTIHNYISHMRKSGWLADVLALRLKAVRRDAVRRLV